MPSEFDKLNARASEAFDDEWTDEQDRSDWFEGEAQALAAKLDAISDALSLEPGDATSLIRQILEDGS